MKFHNFLPFPAHWKSFLVVIFGAIAGLPFMLIKYEFSTVFFTIIGFSFFLTQLFKTQSNKQAFWMGWLFGIGYHTAALYWIVMALSVDWAKFWLLVPIAVFGIPCFLSLYIGLITLAVHKFGKNKLTKYFIFCIGWILMEVIRGKYFLAFPWNLLGYIWVHSSIIQTTSFIGIYGLTAISIFVVSFLATIRSARYGWIIGYALFIFIADYFMPLYLKNTTQHFYTDHIVHIVQPNISQHERWASNNHFKNFERTILMSNFKETNEKGFIIWPESGVDFYLDEAPRAKQLIADILRPNQILLTGALRREKMPLKLFNSLLAINHNAKTVNYYDKSRLLPYGEYIPARQYMPSQLVGIAAGSVDYSPGKGLETLKIEGFPSFSPLICFEGVFSGEVTVDEDERPDFLLSTANDAWYGNTAGPYQHLHIVRVRSIEEGLPMVRVSNNGISAIIAPNGEILDFIPLNQKGTRTAKLPEKYPKTLFKKWFS